MMESIQRAMARQNKTKQSAEAFEPPVINAANDIKRVLAQLDPSRRQNQPHDGVQVLADLTGSDGRKSTNFQVHTTTLSKSYRQILLDGFQVVKQRTETAEQLVHEETVHAIEVDGKAMVPPAVVNTEGRYAMDSIIERLLGGYRDGRFVCWNLSDGYTYRYEIFQHRLTRVLRNAGDADSTAGGV